MTGSKTLPDNFDAWDPKIQKEIDDLISLAGPPAREEDNRDLVRQMIVTALKVEHSQLDRGDAKILSRAMRGTALRLPDFQGLSGKTESHNLRVRAHAERPPGVQTGPLFCHGKWPNTNLWSSRAPVPAS